MKPHCTASTTLSPSLRDALSRRFQEPSPDPLAHCSLDEHAHGPHFAAFDSLSQDPTLWIRWYGTEVSVAELSDCPSCELFAGHPGAHAEE